MSGLENLGERLQELRKQRELSMDMVVYDVARTYHIEFNKSNLSRWENGLSYPSLINAAALAKYYNVSLDYLIGNTDIRTPVELLHQPHIRVRVKRQQLQHDLELQNHFEALELHKASIRGKAHGKRKAAPVRSIQNTSKKDD